MQQYDVIILGESLIDFVPIHNKTLGDFRATVGGAPTNVSCGLAKLGNRTALISRVGNDPLGKSIIQTMQEEGVDTSFIQQDNVRHTAVTIVMPESSDMLRYLIYRNNSADGFISFSEIPVCLYKNAQILHCGSLVMSSPISNQTTLKVIESAKDNGMTISVDVNIRPNSWDSEIEMIEQTKKLIDQSNIVKMTKEESVVLNIEPKDLAIESNKIILITDGEKGASVYYKNNYITCNAPTVDVVDVTGGGDAFMSAFLHFYLRHFNNTITEDLLEAGLSFAVCSGSKTVQNHGAIKSLPSLSQIKEMEQKWNLFNKR